MAKYRALKDVPPGIKAGDIVNFNDPLIAEFKPLFESVGDEEETDDTGNPRLDLTGNPDREKLKARATELGLDFAPNIPTAKLVELVREAEEKAEAEAADGEGNPDDGSNSGDTE